MTKSTLTNERLKQLADITMICKCRDEEYQSMSTELLAAREAQGVPVAWQERWGGGEWSWCTKRTFDYMTANPEPIAEVRELFTAPPAPAVPDRAFDSNMDKVTHIYKAMLASAPEEKP